MLSLNLISRFVGLAVFLIGAQLFAADASSDPDRYVRLYERILTREKAGVARLGVVQRLWLSDVAGSLAQRTQRPEFRKEAVALFESALPELPNTNRVDFHLLRALGLASVQLRALGLINPEHEKVLLPFAQKQWKAFLADSADSSWADADNNIRLAEALGSAAFVRLFKDDPAVDSTAIRKRLEQYWDKIKATGDLDEDSSNYTGLGIVHCIELARMLGHEADFRAAGFRRMFERQRDTISATGILPEWADGFFSIDRGAFDFLYLCEYAAKLYDDPTYLTVARRLYDPETFAVAKPDGWCRALALPGLELSSRSPAPLPAASLVNFRANRGSVQPVVDKLILRTGNEPGDAMVFLDLYASGSHSHRSKGPSIGYYEVDGVPLFHNLGRRRTSSAIAGNSFWALEAEYAFPGVWKEGEWFTMSIPAELMLPGGPDSFKVGDRVVLRNFDNRRTKQVWFDNLRLEGKNGVKLLDGFESGKQWGPALFKEPGVKVEDSPDHTQGAASQSVNWGTLKGLGHVRKLADASNLTFRESEYDTLKLDVKYSGIRPYFHLRDLCQQVDIGDQTLLYRVGSAHVEQRGHDAWAEAVFSRYIAPDAQLTRRMVLTAEGCLIINDRWSSGKSHPKWTAGQLWQFYAVKERGADWVCGDDDGTFTVPRGGRGKRSQRLSEEKVAGRLEKTT